MKPTNGVVSVPSPNHAASAFMAYETECRSVLEPLLVGLLDMAEAAGWNRRAAASALMFIAAKQVSATMESSKT